MSLRGTGTSWSFSLLSHEDRPLIEHLRNVAKLSKDIVRSKAIQHSDIFSEVAYIIGWTHDMGKATSFFQRHIKEGYMSERCHHSLLSSIFTYFAVKEFLSRNGRLHDFPKLPLISWIVVLKHHGDLEDLSGRPSMTEKLKDKHNREILSEQVSDIVKNHLEELKQIYLEPQIDVEEFINEWESILDYLVKAIRRLGGLDDYFTLLFFYSVLLDADKLDASGLRKPPTRVYDIPSDAVDIFKRERLKVTSSPYNTVREDAYKEVVSRVCEIDPDKDRIMTIELPTGCGKTLTGFSFALKLRERVKREKGFTPRIIYCLPFLSIIDQNADVVADVIACSMQKNKDEILSNILLKHHHLVDITYKTEEEDTLEVEKSLILIEGWHSEIVITTFVQFFHSLITNKNRSARKFHNMVNSIIILDEVQSIPYKYWRLINESLKLLARTYNSWIILMTATMPLIFERDETVHLIQNEDVYYDAFDRINYEFDLRERTLSEFKEHILEEILNMRDKDVMIVMNTIKAAREIYRYLREKLIMKYGQPIVDESTGICRIGDIRLVCLSSYIVPHMRLRRISEIRSKEDGGRDIIVTTQLIEAGVDISADLIYRDIAPLDCIIQAAGRCNRHGVAGKGVVKIVRLLDDRGGHLHSIYDYFLVSTTEEMLGELTSVCEREFNRYATKRYYYLLKNRGRFQDSEKIIGHLIQFRFSEVSNFKLIEEEPYKVDVFVEIDKNAETVMKQYKRALELKERYKRRNELLRIRRAFLSYVISVNKNELGAIDRVGDIYYINHSIIEHMYDLETGFIKDGVLFL